MIGLAIHAGLNLGVPANIRGQRQVVQDVLDADNILAVLVAGAQKRRLGEGGQPIDLVRPEPGVIQRRPTPVKGQ